MGSKETAVDSLTAGDGSYYLEDIRPGSYTLKLDPKTIPLGLFWDKGQEKLHIEPMDKPQEINYGDIALRPSSEHADSKKTNITKSIITTLSIPHTNK